MRRVGWMEVTVVAALIVGTAVCSRVVVGPGDGAPSPTGTRVALTDAPLSLFGLSPGMRKSDVLRLHGTPASQAYGRRGSQYLTYTTGNNLSGLYVILDLSDRVALVETMFGEGMRQGGRDIRLPTKPSALRTLVPEMAVVTAGQWESTLWDARHKLLVMCTFNVDAWDSSVCLTENPALARGGQFPRTRQEVEAWEVSMSDAEARNVR